MRVFISLIILSVLWPQAAVSKEKQSVYDKVMQSRTLRCGYSLWPTYLELDPNTGEFSGIWYEYMNELGKLLDLEIKWVAEVPYGDINVAVKTGRIDAFCSGLWQDIRRARDVDFTIPITYQVVLPVVRADDTRFDKDVSLINDPAVKVVVTDGEMSAVIYENEFSDAASVSLPNMTDASQMLLNVASGKGDVTFTSPETVMRYAENNPGKLKAIHMDKPLRLFAEVLALSNKEHELRRILNHATFELHNNGKIEKIINKYEKHPGSFYRVAKPYEVYQ